jgi:hypothetical protein
MYKYNDTNNTVELIGSSRSRGRVGANNGLQRLDASPGNGDADTRVSRGQNYNNSCSTSSRGHVSNRQISSEAYTQPVK